MSYLFQLHGLLDNNGMAHLDYSRGDALTLNETSLKDGSIAGKGALPYRTAWFVPLVPGSLAAILTRPAPRLSSTGTLPGSTRRSDPRTSTSTARSKRP
ncbi:MAG: hypothetical protein LAO77_16445 [Acidobacteriia bacterium]|nr:hypothetical protein [Terriglobia bacterium]